MQKVDIAYLISYTPEMRGVFDPATATRREVYVTVMSVARTEAYAMLSQGMNPSYVLKLALAEDYEKEHEVAFRGDIYRIVRSYETADGGVELTIERIGTDNA